MDNAENIYSGHEDPQMTLGSKRSSKTALNLGASTNTAMPLNRSRYSKNLHLMNTKPQTPSNDPVTHQSQEDSENNGGVLPKMATIQHDPTKRSLGKAASTSSLRSGAPN